MPLIREAILTTPAPDGGTHIAPLGYRREGDAIVLAPFRPSRTLDHLRDYGVAAISHTDDVRVYAGCLTGRRDWPLTPCAEIPCGRLADAMSHHELRVVHVDDSDAQRPRFHCTELCVSNHAPHPGFNRAQAAVVEACILVSRLHMLPAEQIARDVAYLAVAVDKTAGDREREAWGWLMERIAAHREAACKEATP